LKGNRRLLLILAVIIAMVVLFAQCMDSKPPATEKTYAGAASCKQCHTAIVESYVENVHQQTSAAIEGDQIFNRHLAGKSLTGRTNVIKDHADVYEFDMHTKMAMEKRDGKMFQVVYQDGKEQVARPFDIRIGAGKKAYTYGYWEGSQLRQLPLSYYSTISSWANSPGYPAAKVYLDRPITARCLECHSSFAEARSVPDGPLKVKEELKQTSLIYGIDCERCHGPAGKHVEFHLDHPQEKAAKYIALYKTLSHQQKTDACAVCHSGADTEVQKSTFGFKPGDKLKDYYFIAYGAVKKKVPDVHGNQTALLAQSKCFINSKTMDCSSCHRTHENLKGNLTAYSQKCISCHSTATIKHSKATLTNAVVKTNCIDCHMPEQSSNLISFKLAGKEKTSKYFLRTHKIGVY
jgi:nitrate/TMAO reductase-like tetraheme cytochrome c subunit